MGDVYMKKKILFVFFIGLLVIGVTGCEKLQVKNTNSDKIKEDVKEEKDNGPYKWNVGKYTLETKTNINDYIEDNVWKANELAMSLGWDPYAHNMSKSGNLAENYQVSPNSKAPTYYLKDNVFMQFNYAGSNTNYLSVWLKGERRLYTVLAEASYGDKKYLLNGSDKHLFSMESIVIFTYAMENTDTNTLNNPFENVLYASDKKNNNYRYDQ